MTSAALSREMECKEGKPREDVDTGVQAAPPFWQRIVLRAALLALVGIAAEAFLTQHWHLWSRISS
jgi:hypothetical protein